MAVLHKRQTFLFRDTGESHPQGVKSGEQECIRCRVHDARR